MSDLMLKAVLRMPYEMAMADELSRKQFYYRAQQALDLIESPAQSLQDPDEEIRASERALWGAVFDDLAIKYGAIRELKGKQNGMD